MKNNSLPLIIIILTLALPILPDHNLHSQNSVYFPGPEHQWIRKSPGEVGMNADTIRSAIEFAMSSQTLNSPNMEVNHYQTFGREPFGFGIGPFKTRGSQTGIIVKDGYIIAEWGDPARVDMTHSVTKSFLSAVTGVAYDNGLIRNVHDPVTSYMAPIVPFEDYNPVNRAIRMGESSILEPFSDEYNSKITWDHLLRQTSAWRGSLWGKPDWADRPTGDRRSWSDEERPEPGSVWEYNDVRVNLLALAGTNLHRKPLPQVLKDEIMDPINASPTWRWLGYYNSWIILDGAPVQVPSGGGHWGGGMWINTYDQARFGYLTLHRGRWKNQQILSEEWVELSLKPTDVKKTYGYMNWYLNTDRELLPSAPESAFYHQGAGVNHIYVDPQNNLVVVLRWVRGNSLDEIIARILAAIE